VIKPGWKTSEFWTTLAGQLLALLTLAGIVHGSDAVTLQDALGKCIAAAFVIASNAWVIVRYVQGRTALKELATRASSGTPFLVLIGLALAVAGASASFAPAAPPGHALGRSPTCLFGRQPPRDDTALLMLMQQMIGLQQQTLANQQTILALLHQQHPTAPSPAPAAPPVVIHQYHYNPPLQSLPIAGAPRQELPVEGRPRQDLPIAGQPRQELPEAGRPRQDLPEPGKPRQELPDATRPRQELPASPAMPPATTTRPLPMQRYTVFRSLWKN
jgi:hypothetical protein